MTRVAAVAALLTCLAAVPARAQQPADRILVMPFENVSRESRIVWLGEASAVLLADDLNQLGAPAITRDERREAFDRLKVPPAAALTDATVLRIAQLVRASQVVVGTLRMEGDDVVIHARAITVDSAKIRVRADERASLKDLFGAFERVARRIAPESARSSEEVEKIHPPVGAFEQYIKGLLAETPATAIGYLNAALDVDPKLERARLALWEVYDEQGEHEKALAAVRGVAADAPQARRAQFRAALSQLHLKRYDDAFASFKALAEARSTPALLNNLGVVQLHRGAGRAGDGVPTYYFTRASEADATEHDYFFNLGYAYWLERDTQAAIYWLREAVRRDPTDGDAHYVLGTALASAGHAAEAAREKELARRLSSSYEEWDKRPAADQVPRGLERVKGDVELPHSRQLEETLATSGQRDQQELARFYLDRSRRLFDHDQDSDAIAELNRVLFLSPYEAEAHLLLGRIHLRAGRNGEAMDALKISLWSRETADAHVALAEAYVAAKEPDQARAELERALLMAPAHAGAKALQTQLPPR
jgi:tetratricopeptide (TPR) repeat protein